MVLEKGSRGYETMKNVTSGTAAGFAVIAVGFPFDTLKVRLQTQPVHKPVYNGLTDCFLKTLKWEGIGGLYKGVGSPLIGQAIFRSTMATSYYQVTHMLAGTEREGKRLRPYEYFIGGACTGFVISFVECPVDLIKTKMQIQIIRAKTGMDVQYRNIFHAANVIVRQYGLRGIYQGLLPTFIRNIPSFSLYFGCYELCRDALTPKGKTINDLSSMSLFISGGVAGFSYWFFTYPTDVIKSAIQADDLNKTKQRFNGVGDCIKKLYYEDGGWKRFYRGFTPCLLRSLPANAAMLFTLEKCRQFFD